jgi:hypothetical protein
MNDQSINYAYRDGFLRSTLKGFANLLAREGVIDPSNPIQFEKVQRLIDKELKRAVEAERQFSIENK